MENLIYLKENCLNKENITFILNVLNKENNKLILFYNDNFLFIDNDYNRIKKILKNILLLNIKDYSDYLYKINFYNLENYKFNFDDLKLVYIIISNNNYKDNTFILNDTSVYSMLNFIFCLEDLQIEFLEKYYNYKTGDLIIFPDGWTFYYKIENNKHFIFGKFFI